MNFSNDDITNDKDFNVMLTNFTNKTNPIDIDNIYIYFFYIINNTCDEYKRLIVSLTDNILLKETLMTEIVNNRNEGGRRFNVNGIYSYNIGENDLNTFLNEDGINFSEYKNVDNIKYNKTIDFFEHHNSIFVFFTNEKNKNTKKNNENIKHKTLKNH